MIRENYFVDNVTALQDVHSLLTFDERITFILFELILSEHKVYAWSDHKSFIICQPNDIMPIWAWFADDIDENAVECAADIIDRRGRKRPDHRTVLIAGAFVPQRMTDTPERSGGPAFGRGRSFLPGVWKT